MRPIRYSINITIDGCCDHTAVEPDAEAHAYWSENLKRADTLLMGRVVYQMMEEAWRRPADGVWPDWMDESDVLFAETIDQAQKRVVSTTLTEVDWNAELIRGDLADSVQSLKNEPGREIFVGGVTLPLALAELGLIDEYEFLVHPVIAGRGPTLFAGLQESVDLRLVDRREFSSGAVALRYEPKRPLSQ